MPQISTSPTVLWNVYGNEDKIILRYKKSSRRKSQLIANAPVSAEAEEKSNVLIFFGCDYPKRNPDSKIIAAIGNEIVCGE